MMVSTKAKCVQCGRQGFSSMQSLKAMSLPEWDCCFPLIKLRLLVTIPLLGCNCHNLLL